MEVKEEEIICYVFELFYQCINQVSHMISKSLLQVQSTTKTKRVVDPDWERTYSKNRLVNIERDIDLNKKFNTKEKAEFDYNSRDSVISDQTI